MPADIVKCTNCGDISVRSGVLPLCPACYKGLEDYDQFIANLTLDIEFTISRVPDQNDMFFKL